MPAQRKIFRIEENFRSDPLAAIPAAADAADMRHEQLLGELSALRALLEQRAPLNRHLAETGLVTIAQARELKHELDLIHEAIRRTKQEIGSLDSAAFVGPKMARVGRELDAVVSGTEQATQTILKSAEDIDQIANTLSSLVKNGYAQGLTQDMRDHVVKIFEACNFQDLTGQRINKVVATLQFIEGHIGRMQEIWCSIESAAPAAPQSAKADAASALLNGPKLPDDVGHSSQADIDRMFGT